MSDAFPLYVPLINKSFNKLGEEVDNKEDTK